MQSTDKYKIDTRSWKRRDHYHFFKQFDQPFFGITSSINCAAAWHYCKTYKIPFYLYYLHKSLMAANQIREFRQRMEQDEVVEYQQIAGSITVLRKDETFGFAYFDYHADFKTFAAEAKGAIAAEKTASGLNIRNDSNSLIHYSTLTEISFSSMQHAQMNAVQDSIPKIVFGKVKAENSQLLLPVSVHVNHALCDGLHVSNFLKLFQQKMQIG